MLQRARRRAALWYHADPASARLAGPARADHARLMELLNGVHLPDLTACTAKDGGAPSEMQHRQSAAPSAASAVACSPPPAAQLAAPVGSNSARSSRDNPFLYKGGGARAATRATARAAAAAAAAGAARQSDDTDPSAQHGQLRRHHHSVSPARLGAHAACGLGGVPRQLLAVAAVRGVSSSAGVPTQRGGHLLPTRAGRRDTRQAHGLGARLGRPPDGVAADRRAPEPRQTAASPGAAIAFRRCERGVGCVSAPAFF